MENEELTNQDRAIGGALIVGGVAAMLSGMGYIFNKLNKKIDTMHESLNKLTQEQQQTIDYALSPNISLKESFMRSEKIVSKKDYSSIVIMLSFFRELEIVLKRKLDEMLVKHPESKKENTGRESLKNKANKIIELGENNLNLMTLINDFDGLANLEKFSVYQDRNKIIHTDEINYDLLLPEFQLIKEILTDYSYIYEQVRADKKKKLS